MGEIHRTQQEQALGVGRQLSSAGATVVVFGHVGQPSFGLGHDMRFKLAGNEDHRQIVRLDKNGNTTTARPASMEEGFLYAALEKALEALREANSQLMWKQAEHDATKLSLTNASERWTTAKEDYKLDAAKASKALVEMGETLDQLVAESTERKRKIGKLQAAIEDHEVSTCPRCNALHDCKVKVNK